MCPIDIALSDFWHLGDDAEPSPIDVPIWRPDIWATIETRIVSLDSELRDLSLDIHGHPELGFKEFHTHDVLTEFMGNHGFDVTKHYILQTGWRATFQHGKGGRTLGVNSEMDALPQIGHACGHNLIAISGAAIACAIRIAMLQYDIPGTVILLGTPAEENGGGKKILLEAGAYQDMDACIMCHPSPGPNSSSSIIDTLARQEIEVNYIGSSAHASYSPWEGKNALDAAVLAYNSISALRQQLHPTIRVHGTFNGHDWTPNIIPDNSKMTWYVRAPSWSDVQQVVRRLTPCFEAAAMATGCKVKIELNTRSGYYELRQNPVLADKFENLYSAKFGPVYRVLAGASTDFGNVTYALPGLHPAFAIPTVANGGNHTPAFKKSAATLEAHVACLNISKVLAATGIRVLVDDKMFKKVSVHAELLFGASKDHPELYTYFPWGPFDSLQELKQDILDNWVLSDRALFAVFDKKLQSTPTLAGVIGFLNTSVRDLCTEIGHVITIPRYQRTHVTTNSVGLLLGYCLEVPEKGGLGLRRVQWQATENNKKSIAAATKMGFRLEGICRWQRTLSSGKEASSNGKALREGDPSRTSLGRNSAVLAMCWDDWEEGVNEKVASMMKAR